ncbi:MAG: ribonuclease T2 [Nevskia sp.]|nr:ribonuclease T2 [Nevskia sp.]
MCGLLLAAALLLAATALADSTPGRFDYYLLSLSWSPEYCAKSHRDDEQQCAHPYAFVAHGLWPQDEQGWPSDCPSRERVPDATIERLLPMMPNRGLIIHEWHRHGSCSGLHADAYFSMVEQAYHAITIPARYQRLSAALSISLAELRRDLLAANPAITRGALILQCSGRYLQEVRICLDRELQPRTCSSEQRDRCGERVLLRPVRTGAR